MAWQRTSGPGQPGNTNFNCYSYLLHLGISKDSPETVGHHLCPVSKEKTKVLFRGSILTKHTTFLDVIRCSCLTSRKRRSHCRHRDMRCRRRNPTLLKDKEFRFILYQYTKSTRHKSGDRKRRWMAAIPPSSLCLYQPNFFIIFFLAIAAPLETHRRGLRHFVCVCVCVCARVCVCTCVCLCVHWLKDRCLQHSSIHGCVACHLFTEVYITGHTGHCVCLCWFMFMHMHMQCSCVGAQAYVCSCVCVCLFTLCIMLLCYACSLHA